MNTAKPKNILIVEDDETIREALTDILDSEGYLTSSASDGQEALDRIFDEGYPDLILLDLTMPVLNGWDFLKIRARDPRLLAVPVIVCSATGDRSETVLATRVFRKPLQLQPLLEEIAKALTPASMALRAPDSEPAPSTP